MQTFAWGLSQAIARDPALGPALRADVPLAASLGLYWLASACLAALGLLVLAGADTLFARRCLLAPLFLIAPILWFASPSPGEPRPLPRRAGQCALALAGAGFVFRGLDLLLKRPNDGEALFHEFDDDRPA